MDNISHISIVTSSLSAIYNQSRITGKLNSSNLYLLEAINKLLGGCTTSLTTVQKRILFSLYNSILTSSKEICNVPLQNLTDVQSKPKFVQNNVQHTDVYNTVFNNIFS